MSYILNGVTLKTPSAFNREYIKVARDEKTLNGRTGRDKRVTKERFILSWEHLSSSELGDILTIIELNQAVTFLVNETNLLINETNVIVNISDVTYVIPGSNYIASTRIELKEVN